MEKSPKKEKKKEDRKKRRIRRREKRQRLECNENRRKDSTAGKEEGRKGVAGGNGKGQWKGGTDRERRKRKRSKGREDRKTSQILVDRTCHGLKMEPFIRDTFFLYTGSSPTCPLSSLSSSSVWSSFLFISFCWISLSMNCVFSLFLALLSKIARAPSQSQKEGFHAQYAIHTIHTCFIPFMFISSSCSCFSSSCS